MTNNPEVSPATDESRIECISCGAVMHAVHKTKFSPEVMTVRYTIAEGRFMIAEDLCDSVKALAKSLKLIAKEMGTKVTVGIVGLECKPGEISVSVSVVPLAKPEAVHEPK